MKVQQIALLFTISASPLVHGSNSSRLDRLEREVSELHMLVQQLRAKIGSHHEAVPVIEHRETSHSSYRVVSGDTFWGIAKRHGMNVSSLKSLNPNINPRKLKIGTRLTLSGHSSASATSAPDPKPRRANGNYKVRSGDTLGHIAQAHGISLRELLSQNPGIKPDRIKIGQSLRVPEGRSAPVVQNDPIISDFEPSPREELPPLPDPEPTPAPVEERAGNDTRLIEVDVDRPLSEIANRYQTSVATLNVLNDVQLGPDQLIQRGSQLYVPGN